MGFFSKVRRRIKKLIPKEVRPFIPYAAAMIPGLQAMGPLSGIGSMAARKALIAGGTKFLTDDEADLKDIARTSALAAAPDFLSDQMQMGANRLNLAQTGSNVSKTAEPNPDDKNCSSTVTIQSYSFNIILINSGFVGFIFHRSTTDA